MLEKKIEGCNWKYHHLLKGMKDVCMLLAGYEIIEVSGGAFT